MATLILEDLNLVTLNELLQRLPHNTLVGELTAIINERELFRPEEADAIVAHFSGTRPAVKMGDDHGYTLDVETVKKTLISLMSENCGAYIGDIDIPLMARLPMHINRTHQLRLSQYPNDETTIHVYNPTIGKAFWPSVNEVVGWIIEGGMDNVAEVYDALTAAAEKKANESRRA